jgi:hypothetical protein
MPGASPKLQRTFTADKALTPCISTKQKTKKQKNKKTKNENKKTILATTTTTKKKN